MTTAWARLRRFGRRTGAATLWAVALLAAVVAANALGIALLGSLDGWQRWLAQASGVFLLWRLCLYAATAYGWRWMRRRVLARDDSDQARRRLVRTEVAAVVAIAALEIGLLMRAGA
ncbi:MULTISPECIES: hypothetical protein [Pseudomonadota]|uniref:hypothetical protein n=1 Tax=Pseudomonadota TaxID=1224 RepID=UPI001B6BDBDF|nr:hypothetical protein [Pseudoxanthomonas sp.]MCH4578097.1 hypothetical protein [Achromobacter xylosoxidans]